MEIKTLQYTHVFSAAQCVSDVISPLPFYSEFARQKEIEKFNSDNLWTFVKDTDRCNIIAVEDGNIIGFLFGVVDASVLFVMWIGIKQPYQRLGHMRSLWFRMEEWCREKNIHRVWCDTNQLNVPAISFMQQMDMNQCGNLKNFWYGHDYFLWEKTIDGKPNGKLFEDY